MGHAGAGEFAVRFHEGIRDIPAEQWDRLFASDYPFIRHAFLAALEDSGSVAPDNGWTPQHLAIDRDGELVAAMPLYLKAHSQGEFVFDWAWAEAYARHGQAYYPKLLTAIPFTPCQGPRIGLRAGVAAEPLVAEIVSQLRAHGAAQGCSGWNLLFAEPQLESWLADAGLLVRRDVQFHWRNCGYGDFGDYLDSLKSSRRKNLRKERGRVGAAGVDLRRIDGPQITDQDWDAFYQCYRDTYLKRSGHGGYLNRAFFGQLRQSMADSLVLVVAERSGKCLASALFLADQRRLYGRYWGALEEVDCLHFECCFYQGIEYCIEKGIEVFDPGTQGEHKLLRGFEPVETASLHWISDPRFRAAIGDYLERERAGVRAYRRQAEALLPYRESGDQHGA